MPRQRKRAVHGGGSVYQRASDGRWVAKFKVEATGKFKELYAKTEKQAYERLQKALFEQKQGILATGPQQTVKQFLEYWLEDVHKPAIRLSTYVAYAVIVRKHLIPVLGHLKLQKLTVQHVQSLYAKKLREKLSSARVRTIHAVLHKALDYAVRVNLVAQNVSERAELPRLERSEVRPLTLEQAQVFMQKVREHRLEALFVLALTTGMRQGELLALRWQDVDLHMKSLQVLRTVVYLAKYGFVEGEPKTKAGRRSILLPDVAVDVLKQHRVMQLEARLVAGSSWLDRDLVFCGMDGGYIVAKTLRSHYSMVLKEAGLPHKRFHDLRHSAATLLLSVGVPMKVVQELLGHSDMSMTANVYSHVLPSMQEEAMDKMDSLFGHQGESSGG